MPDWSLYLDRNDGNTLGDFLDLLRIPSVSTDPSLAGEVRRAAVWAADRLKRAGMEKVAVMETGGHPAVYGEWLHAGGKPTALVYGHYDVQPPDPLPGWTSPPFEPGVRDGRIYARGACDMKGNLVLAVAACEALLRTEGALPINLKFLFEGEEEIGSPSLARFMDEHRELLACDFAISADTGQYGEEQPAVVVAAKGICCLQVDVRTGDVDLHSGLAGGAASNAVHVLARLLASLRGADGRILVEGFYDDVNPPDREDLAAMERVPDDTERLLRGSGFKAAVGEAGFPPQVRRWARPTLDVVGAWGGYLGRGVKTIIPCEAHAKITCRLVPDQSPGRVLELLQAHFLKDAPPEAEVSASPLPGEAHPYLLPGDHPALAAAERALREVYGREPYRVRTGGSVPVLGMLREKMGVHTVSMGFSLDDERMHAPDEFMRVSSFKRGQRVYCLFFEELGKMAP